MAVYLVRHAKAGRRSDWCGPDHLRPLTRSGWRQAEALVPLLADAAPPRIVSSPYVRCLQTVEPLARAVGLEVEALDALAEGEPFAPVVDLVAGADESTVLCSHGDVIPATIDALVRRGAVVTGAPDWRKGSTWVIERGGPFERWALRALPPPDA